jgi:hypothetical protein
MRMRNSWKGLVVGGLTGAVVGIALDVFASALKQATRTAENARERAPEAVDWLQTVTESAAKWVHDSDVPDRVREVAQRILDSDFAATAHETASKVVDATKDRARTTLHHSP